jgi:hypothetical protein
MKTKTVMIGIAALLSIISLAWAADIAGKWTAQAGDTQITLTFKADGNTLTGTVDNPQAGPADIKDGKIDGDNISFNVVRKMGETEMKLVWKGKIAGDEIKFTREVQGGMGGPGGAGGATEIIAKRAK